MKLPARFVAWVLPLLLTGCFLHKTPKQPAEPLAPKLENSSVPPPTQQPPPEVTIPTQQPVSVTKLPEQTPKPPPKHKKPPANPTPDVQQASVGTPAVNAIGQLSSGDPADQRRQTEGSIASTERGLNDISPRLNDQDQKTAAHIREFLKQAKAALASGDVDGASTLAAKAKVLLGELQH
jgi:outer membrane biosynthesis protein TonB